MSYKESTFKLPDNKKNVNAAYFLSATISTRYTMSMYRYVSLQLHLQNFVSTSALCLLYHYLTGKCIAFD